MTVCIKTFKTIRNQLLKKSLKGLLDAIIHSDLDYRRILLIGIKKNLLLSLIKPKMKKDRNVNLARIYKFIMSIAPVNKVFEPLTRHSTKTLFCIFDSIKGNGKAFKQCVYSPVIIITYIIDLFKSCLRAQNIYLLWRLSFQHISMKWNSSPDALKTIIFQFLYVSNVTEYVSLQSKSL